jgi:hypothetical protein
MDWSVESGQLKGWMKAFFLIKCNSIPSLRVLLGRCYVRLRLSVMEDGCSKMTLFVSV